MNYEIVQPLFIFAVKKTELTIPDIHPAPLRNVPHDVMSGSIRQPLRLRTPTGKIRKGIRTRKLRIGRVDESGAFRRAVLPKIGDYAGGCPYFDGFFYFSLVLRGMVVCAGWTDASELGHEAW